MKELIDKLLKGEGKLSLFLLEAKEFVETANDEELLRFIDHELNGYSPTDSEFPSYRQIRSEIVGTIEDVYGRIVQRGKPIDFSVISNKLGFDLSVTYIPDGIGFIEDSLAEVHGPMVERPLHSQLIKMLGEMVTFNNPALKLTSASHQFGKAAAQFILTKVREELIIGLRKINNDSQKQINDLSNLNPSISIDDKKVFVTYAWENEEHNDKVISFVNFLRLKGYDTTMDRKESQEQSAINFNQMMISGIQNSNKVIVVLSKKYKEKANSFSGGVGFEYKIILEQMKQYQNKFIFVSFGKNLNEEIVPTGISGVDILNLKKDQDEVNFNGLFAKLGSKNILNFSEVSEIKVEIKTKEIEPFKL